MGLHAREDQTRDERGGAIASEPDVEIVPENVDEHVLREKDVLRLDQARLVRVGAFGKDHDENQQLHHEQITGDNSTNFDRQEHRLMVDRVRVAAQFRGVIAEVTRRARLVEDLGVRVRTYGRNGGRGWRSNCA